MRGIIEEKGTQSKIISYRIIFIVIIFIVLGNLYNSISNSNFSELLGFFYLSIPILIIGIYIILHNSYEFIVNDDEFIAKRILFKTLIFPLKDILKIEKRRRNTIGKYYFVIRYKNKKIILNPYYFRRGGVGFDNVITELQKRVDKAK